MIIHRTTQGGIPVPIEASRRPTRKAFRALSGFSILPALGIACFRLTAWSLFSSDAGGLDADLAFVSRVLQAVVMLLIIVIDRVVVYNESVLLKSAGVAAVGMAIGAVVFLLGSSEEIRYVGCALNGAASAGVMMGWGYYLCSIDTKQSAFGITLAFALYGLATWAFSVLPLQWLTGLVTVLPLVSFICLWLSLANVAANVEADTPLSKSLLRAIPWGMVALLLICTAISILAKLIVPVNSVLSVWSYRLYWPAIFVAIFVLFFVWMFVLKRDDQDALWPIFILVIFSGLVCYSSFSLSQPEFAASFLRATQECLMLFCWVMTASVVYTQRLPRLFFFGASMLIFVAPPTLTTSLLSLLIPSVGSDHDQQLAITTTVIMALLLIALTVVLVSANSFLRAKSLEKSAAASVPPAQDPLIPVVEEIASEYGLTKRESEMSLYLARGYTLPQTADMLCVSLDTIRSHTKNLYRKLDIHKKQQLIEIIEHKRNRDGESDGQ